MATKRKKKAAAARPKPSPKKKKATATKRSRDAAIIRGLVALEEERGPIVPGGAQGGVVAKRRREEAAEKAAAVVETCSYCGQARSEEELGFQKTHGRMSCPECGREGCFQCMPAGRGCMCSECEESGPDEEGGG